MCIFAIGNTPDFHPVFKSYKPVTFLDFLVNVYKPSLLSGKFDPLSSDADKLKYLKAANTILTFIKWYWVTNDHDKVDSLSDDRILQMQIRVFPVREMAIEFLKFKEFDPFDELYLKASQQDYI
jgi:hypothetical protein